MPETSDFRKYWVLASPRQREYIQAIETNGNMARAEKALGVSRGIVSRSMGALEALASKRGFHPDENLNNPLPAQFRAMGVSIYHKADGDSPAYWLKGKARPEAMDHAKELAEELRAEFESAAGLYPATPRPKHLTSDLIVDYRFGDPHFGMYGEAEYNSEVFCTDRSTKLTQGAIDLLTQQAPSSAVAHLTWIGDNTHANDYKHETPQSHNRLDMDPRGHGYALKAACRAAAYSIRALLKKHETVVVNIIEGNHDPDAAFSLNLMLSMLFENEPRAVFDVSRPLFRHYEYGNVMLSYHHGDKVKKDNMPLLMATDEPEMWGRTKYREAVTGHIHHETVKEVMGVRVVSLSTLGAQDAYHYSKGYRSLSATTASVFHRVYGQLSTVNVSAAMINDLT